MRSKIFCITLALGATLLLGGVASAQTTESIPPNVLKVLEENGALESPVVESQDQAEAEIATLLDEYFRARVVEVIEEGTENVGGLDQKFQKIRVEILDGEDKERTIEFKHGGDVTLRDDQFVSRGEKIVLIKQRNPDGTLSYGVVDTYRLPSLVMVIAFFLALTVFFGRGRGVGALIGLVLSIFVLAKMVVPQVLAGANPFWICFLGSVIISVLSMYFAHGLNRRATVALISTLGTLVIAAGLSFLFVWLTKLSGFGNEDTFYLQVSPVGNLDFRGLLLGAILIGTLGVLEDITIGQSAAVDEIHRANPGLSFTQLYTRGISVGREHISALVNTLALAYAGASFPLFLLFSIYKTQPAWVIFNSQMIVEEIVRTLVGSSALILAVPMTTILTAYLWTKQKRL